MASTTLEEEESTCQQNIFCHGWCRIIHRKGIVAASLGRLLKNRGLKVTIQKI